MFEISQQIVSDDAEIEVLMSEAFGSQRYERSVWFLRTVPAVSDLCLVLRNADAMLASLRFWEVRLNEHIELLLGPLAVRPDLRGKGYGRQIVAKGLSRARAMRKWSLVLVSGEPDYFPKFGFVSASFYELQWPGFVETERLQLLELEDGALAKLTPPVKVQAMSRSGQSIRE